MVGIAGMTAIQWEMGNMAGFRGNAMVFHGGS